MTEAAEQRIEGKGWLPEVRRRPVGIEINADCPDLRPKPSPGIVPLV
jgi:hypothetical protein